MRSRRSAPDDVECRVVDARLEGTTGDSEWRDNPCRSSWRSRGGSAPGSSAPWTSWNERWRSTVRRSTSGTKSSTTSTSSTACAPRGARFVEDLADIPKGAITVFSAHGVSRKVEDDAGVRGLQVIDATCPLVSKVHNEARRYAREDHEIILIGHPGHPEVEGTIGQVAGEVFLVSDLADVAMLAPANPAKLAYVTQTTLSVDDTRENHRGTQGAFSGDPRPRREGHLLRHPEPADRGAVVGGSVRRGPGARRPTTARTPTGCSSSARRPEPTAISFRMPGAWTRPGWRVRGRWESPPARRPLKCWSSS